jgi:hypothetical protein
MAVIMINIPRRKIYEAMLIFEDGMIEMNILLYSKENFEKFLKPFNQKGFKNIRKGYFESKALLVMFLENRKYNNENEFQNDLLKLVKSNKITNKHLMKNKNLPLGFKWTIKKVDFELEKVKRLKTMFVAKRLYKDFDKYNDYVPKILEIRRDFMKK